jgi:signal transduction histidine kinase
VTFKGSEYCAIELKAIATPIVIRGERFTVFALQDISSEKRRDVLERTFFHDVLNTAGGIHGLATLLVEHGNISSHVEDEYKNWLVEMSGNLVEEIHHQRKLLMAERGEYQPQIVPVTVRNLLEEVLKLYLHHDRTPGRELVLAEVPECTLLTDHPVLRRIIGNMVINALEATAMGGVVTIYSNKTDSDVFINVHNLGVMPRDVQLQLFMRSFSTKSNLGRGIGTYSMKLFGERYLNGKVSFRSNQEDGTIFTISLPLEP